MKTWLIVLVCVMIGLISGVTGTVIELGASPTLDKPLFPTPEQEPGLDSGPKNGPHAKIEFEHEFYDAGPMQRDVEYSHVFVLHNVGQQPLKLRQGETSCKCTMSKLATDHVDVGGQAEVKLIWTPFKDGPFGQRAEVLTNDPARPRVSLIVKGRVLFTHAIVPERISIGGLSVNESQQGQVRLLSYRDDLKIEETKLADPDTSKFFDVQVSPIGAEELKVGDPDAKSGYLVNLSVKPGLPLGPIHQRILLRTNLPTGSQVEIPIDGVITGDITVYGVGSEYDKEHNVLSIGTVKRHEGAIANLLVRIKGAEHKTAELKLADVQPNWLKVEMGDAKENPEESVVSIPLKIEVPEDVKPFVMIGPQKSHMGFIHLSTGMKSAPELKIYVSLAVED